MVVIDHHNCGAIIPVSTPHRTLASRLINSDEPSHDTALDFIDVHGKHTANMNLTAHAWEILLGKFYQGTLSEQGRPALQALMAEPSREASESDSYNTNDELNAQTVVGN